MWFSLQSSAGGFLHPVLNMNVAFSLRLPGFSGQFLTLLLTLIVIGFFIMAGRLYRMHDVNALWWLLITIGALSNVLDRIVLGGVLDYVDLKWFPAFNMSDVFITIGVIMLLYRELFHGRSIARGA